MVIEAPEAATARFDGGNTSEGSYMFELAGTDNVTVDHRGAMTGPQGAQE